MKKKFEFIYNWFEKAGQVIVRFRSDAKEARIEVEDNGPGIPAEFHEKIFEKFLQGAERSKTSTGLGLAFCKMAIESHGGRIFVESSVGMGSRFIILLPRSTATEGE